MSFPGVTFVSELEPVTAKELQALTAQLEGFLAQEHHADGGHTNITADSIRLSQEGEGVILEGTDPNGSRDATLTNTDDVTELNGPTVKIVARTGEIVLEVLGAEQAAFGRVVTSAGTEQQMSNYLSALGALRFSGQGVYTPSNFDTSALSDATFAPLYSFYRLTPSANVVIDGIYVDLVGGGRGQVIATLNDSAFAITFQTVVVSNARKILGDPVTIGPNGVVIFIYDNTNAGWRISSVFPGDPMSYTPVWTGAVSNPAIGNGTIVGEWQQIGKTVQFRIRIDVGSTTTFGSGNYSFSLPATATFTVSWLVGPSMAFDASPGAIETGVSLLASATTVNLFSISGVASPTVPYTWATGDVIILSGAYFRA